MRAASRAPRRAAARATPKPTMPLTFSVPARRSRSWCPPPPSGANGAPRRMYARRRPSAVKLVRRQRQRIDAQRVDVDVDLPRRLHGVGVKQRARLVRRARQRRDVVDVAQLVIRERQRHQHRVRPQRRAQGVDVDAAVRVDGDVRDVGALGGQRARNRRMLEARRDHVRGPLHPRPASPSPPASERVG
jgi:hypothetical protein